MIRSVTFDFLVSRILKLNIQVAIFIFLFSTHLLPSASFGQTKISPYLLGQNAWEKNSLLKVKDQISKVKYQTIRIGGNGYENAGFINQGAVELIDYARSVGAEPVLQMPRHLKDDNEALKAIEFINGRMGRKIRFWSIGNEPDHRNQLASPEEVFDYFSKISAQIKSYDPEAKIMGFDLSSYKAPFLERLLGGDLDITGKVPGKDYYYLDMVAFHNYRFTDISHFETNVRDLKKRLAVFNAKRSAKHQLSWAITEFNSHWLVDDPKLNEKYLPYTFHNGQIYAEMYDLGMREGAFTICPWSILEGGADREGTDLSLFDLVDGKYLPRSNYYHSLLLAQNVKKTYLQHSPNPTDLVVIPMGDETGMAIMILNKNRENELAYTLNFSTKKADSRKEEISINAGLNNRYKSSVPVHSTQMLIFDKKGKLLKKYSYSAKDADAMSGLRETDF